MIETYGYARAGLLGNPSDGYFGKTIAFAMSNFRARVLLYPSGRLEINPQGRPSRLREPRRPLPHHAVARILRRHSHYPGADRAALDYCREPGTELPNRNFTLEYESTIPQRLGLGGSSAIITASLRALCQYYDLRFRSRFSRTSCSRPRPAN